MNRVNILDCTLRDGGYVNDFNFGESVIKSIISKLTKASIDIIECGWLKSGAFDKDKSRFGSIEAIKATIEKKNPTLLYVAMIQYGAISNDEITPCDVNSIDGIRITFHEHEIDDAFELGRQLMDKGYKIFMQPVGTTTYTDEALLQLIKRINELSPFAFYLVDTLGVMYKNDLLRMFYLIDHNLDRKIALGFHSHNNLQLSFANAQELARINSPRTIIIDSSVYGIGRGAGNLNTELVTQFINTNFGLKYDNLEILEILDEYIKPLSIQYKWGYDAAYYIASICGCHPNYASFLLNKQTLHVQDIYSILNRLDERKRGIFDKKYAGQEYLNYMSHHVDDHNMIAALAVQLKGKKILLLAPGKSLRGDAQELDSLARSGDYYVISINFIPTDIRTDMMFISNMKRFRDIKDLGSRTSDEFRIVATSNITTEPCGNMYIADFSSYTNEEQCISDNAGLMCINLLKKVGVEKVLLAGFDGYTNRVEDNYFSEALYLDVEAERLMRMNIATAKKIEQLSNHMKIEYFSKSVYQEQQR